MTSLDVDTEIAGHEDKQSSYAASQYRDQDPESFHASLMPVRLQKHVFDYLVVPGLYPGFVYRRRKVLGFHASEPNTSAPQH